MLLVLQILALFLDLATFFLMHFHSFLKNRTCLQSKIAKFYVHFQTKMAQKPYPLGQQIPIQLYKEVLQDLSLNFTNFCFCWQVKPNQFSVSYHIAQYTNIIADLRKEIFRLKLKISEHDTESNNGNSSSKFLKDSTLSYQLSLKEIIIMFQCIPFTS